MTIQPGNIPYSQIGPKVKFVDIDNRIYKRVLYKLFEHHLYEKVDNHDWYAVFSLAGRPKKGEGKVSIDDIEDLDESKSYVIRVVIPLEFQEKYLIDAEIVVVGSLEFVDQEWVMEPKSWEHNTISRQVSPSCEQLLFHSRDFSQEMLPGHSSKNPWHHQWHVTTKKKLENESAHHFIWKPYYYQSPANGIHDGKRWLYKTNQYQAILEFMLKDFFDFCDNSCTGGIRKDRGYYINF
ncbi:MAG: hypothetical protein AB7I27_00210 [Bacteriovoracaceae bacterium]